MNISSNSNKLKDIIIRAIDDCKITAQEYEDIINQAGRDSLVDPHEQALLAQLHDMINNGSIKRVGK